MRVLTLSATSGADGTLHIDVPGERPDSEYDVAVVVMPKSKTIRGSDDSPESRGWSKEFVEEVLGSFDDDFVRHPQGELPPARTWE